MTGRKGHLRFKGISDRTARSYRKEVHRFFVWLELEHLEIPNEVSHLDTLVGEYINVMYQDGDSLSQAGWLLSGLKRFIPSLRHELPTGQQYYNNWVRDHIPQRALPMPWHVLKGLAGAAWNAGHQDLALCLLLGYTFFLRTTEMVTLRIEDIIVSRRFGQIVLTLRQTKTSKQFAQTLVLRHRPLCQVIPAACAHLPTSGPVWRHTARQFRLAFSALLSHFDLSPHGFSLYSIRRGGATHCYVRARDLHQVAIQGRWKDLRTARIYLDDARATLLKFSLPPHLSHALAQATSCWAPLLPG